MTPWMAEANEYFEKEKNIDVADVFSKIVASFKTNKRGNKRKLGLTRSTESGGRYSFSIE